MDVFSTGVLAKVVALLQLPPSFLLNRFFPVTQEEDSEEIHFDIDQRKRRITPFVAPIRAGRVIDNEGFKTATFKPAYAKDKRRFNPNDPLKRAIGERIGGELSPQERRDLQVQRAVMDQLEMLTRREEVMASEVLRSGKVTVKGDGYPTTLVDFGRAAALTIALAGNDLWSDLTNSTPLKNIEDWAGLIQTNGGGAAMDVVMAPDAWLWFRQHAKVEKVLDIRRGSESVAEIGPQRARPSYAQFKGTIGEFTIWAYNDVYLDDDGATQNLMPSGAVVVSGPNLEGVRAYGAIQDEKAGYTARRFFVKSWLEEDPAVRWLMLQSAPLVVPYRVNGSLGATVL